MMISNLFLAAVLAAGGPAPQQPSSVQADTSAQPRWYLDGSTSRCVLTRRLEGTPGPAAFVLRSVPGSGSYDVMLAIPDLDRTVQRVRLSTGAATHEQSVSIIELPRGLGSAFAIPYLPASFAGEFGRASRIELADDQGRHLGSWNVPAAARAAETLADCEAEKQVDWGADRAATAPGSTPPRAVGNASRWIGPEDLGVAGVASQAIVAAVFRVSVGANGRATDCTVLESAGSFEIDRGACGALVRRARYEPARDPSGNPVRSVAIYRVEARSRSTRGAPGWRAAAAVATPAS
jgi:hypothetical protein